MFENFLFEINHYGPFLECIKNKIGGMGLRSGFLEKKIEIMTGSKFGHG